MRSSPLLVITPVLFDGLLYFSSVVGLLVLSVYSCFRHTLYLVPDCIAFARSFIACSIYPFLRILHTPSQVGLRSDDYMYYVLYLILRCD